MTKSKREKIAEMAKEREKRFKKLGFKEPSDEEKKSILNRNLFLFWCDR